MCINDSAKTQLSVAKSMPSTSIARLQLPKVNCSTFATTSCAYDRRVPSTISPSLCSQTLEDLMLRASLIGQHESY